MNNPTSSLPTNAKAFLPGINRRWIDSFQQTAILAVLLAAMAIYFSVSADHFLTSTNALNIFINASVLGIVSLGQLLTLIAGHFDLSVGGVVPLGAVAYAILLNAGVPLPAALLMVTLIGCICGLANGLLVAKARINALIATLGTLSVTGGLALTLSNGVQIPFADVADGILSRPSFLGVNNHVWLFLTLALVTLLVLRFTVYGRQIYAVGGNREAARLAGIRVDGTTISVFVVCGGLAALSGAVIASQLLTGSGLAGTTSGLQSITAVILGGAALTGGVGSVPGTLIGVLILGTLANGMAIMSVPSFYQSMATGVVLLLAVGISQLRNRRR